MSDVAAPLGLAWFLSRFFQPYLDDEGMSIELQLVHDYPASSG